MSKREGGRALARVWIMQHQNGVGSNAAGVSHFEHVKDRGWSVSCTSQVAAEGFEETGNMTQVVFKRD